MTSWTVQVYFTEKTLMENDAENWQLHFKEADYLSLYEQNWLKEGTEALVLKKTAESSK